MNGRTPVRERDERRPSGRLYDKTAENLHERFLPHQLFHLRQRNELLIEDVRIACGLRCSCSRRFILVLADGTPLHDLESLPSLAMIDRCIRRIS